MFEHRLDNPPDDDPASVSPRPPAADSQPLLRDAFRAGVKAAIMVQRFQTYGEVWCSACGGAWTDLQDALRDLDMRAVQNSGRAYRHEAEWGDDHPGNLVLVCSGCGTASLS